MVFVRHGQASFDNDNYDQLSELGHRQACYLGEHFARLGKSFDRLVVGSMRRHQETATGILLGMGLAADHLPMEQYAGLDEYDFKVLIRLLAQVRPELLSQLPDAKRAYYYNIRQALQLWMNGEIAATPESEHETWLAFTTRVTRCFENIYAHPAKNTLVISSGGPISVVLGDVLQLAAEQIRSITLQIKNSAYQSILYDRKRFTLDCFNNVGHLEGTGKQDSITFL